MWRNRAARRTPQASASRPSAKAARRGAGTGGGAPLAERELLAAGELEPGLEERRDVGGHHALAVHEPELGARGAYGEPIRADEAVPAQQDPERRRAVHRVEAHEAQRHRVAVARVEVVLARQAHGEPEARAVGGEAHFRLHVARVHADRGERGAHRLRGLGVREELVALGDHRHRHRREAPPGLGAADDRVEEAVPGGAGRGEGRAVEGGKARQDLVQLAAPAPLEEDRLRAAERRERGGGKGCGERGLVHGRQARQERAAGGSRIWKSIRTSPVQRSRTR